MNQPMNWLKRGMPLLLTCAFVCTLIGTTPALAATSTLKIALLTAEESTDQSAVWGAQLAVDLLNDAGGVMFRDATGEETIYRFTLVQRAGATPTEMHSAIQASLDEEPLALVGPQQDDLIAGNLDLANTEKVPHLYAASVAQTNGGTYAFNLRTTHKLLAADIADYLIGQRHLESVATASDTSTEAKNDLASFNATASRLGVQPSPAVSYDPGATRLETEAETLADADSEAVVIFGEADNAALLTRTLRLKGYDGLIVFAGMADPAAWATFVQEAGADSADVIGPALWNHTLIDSGSAAFVKAYQARYNALPDLDAALSFDGVLLLAEAVARAGDDPVEVRQALADGVDFGGVMGVYGKAAEGRLITASAILHTTSDASDGGLSELARYADGACWRGCADIRAEDVNAAETTDTQIVRLAFVGPQSGPDGDAAELARYGAEMAVQQINQAGGVIGANNIRYKFELRAAGAATSDETARALDALLASKPAALLGPNLSGALIPNLGKASAARIPQLTTASAETVALSESAGYVMQLRPGDTLRAAALADYLVDVEGVAHLAVFSAATVYGQSGATAFASAIDARDDATLVYSASRDLFNPVDAALASEILATGPDAIAVFAPPDMAVALLEALRAAGYQGRFAYDAIDAPGFLNTFTSDQRAGVIGVGSWSPAALDIESASFAAAFQRIYGRAPNAHAAAYYDAVHLIAQNVATGGPNPATLASALTRVEGFSGVQGVYTAQGSQLGRTILIYESSESGLQEISRWQATGEPGGALCVSACWPRR